MAVSEAILQEKMLKLLASGNVHNSIGRGERGYYLAEAFYSLFEPDDNIGNQHYFNTVWALISQGLAYIDFQQPATENWYLKLTKSGEEVARGEEIYPEHPEGYFERLKEMVPDVSETVLKYVRESLFSYKNRCYLSSAVMLGVASEAAFLELINSFCDWMPEGKPKEKLLSKIENPKESYSKVVEEFRNRIIPYLETIPKHLTEDMELTINSIQTLIRYYRNDAGHPTGKDITPDDAYANLKIFAGYLKRLYELKSYFDAKK